MIRKYFFTFLLTTLLFFFTSLLKAKSKDDECKCDFDTATYTAVCDCVLTCAVAIKNGKNCNIVCDGSPATAEPGNYRLFGKPFAYLKEMASIRHNISSAGFMAFRNTSFAQKALPSLLRSAYIGASFISPEKKQELDTLVHEVFSKFDEQIRSYLIQENKGVFEKEFKDGNRIMVSFKLIKLTVPNYKVRLLFIR